MPLSITAQNRGLKEIAKTIKTLAILYAPISHTAPKLKKGQRTRAKIGKKIVNLKSHYAGNLKRQLTSWNTYDRMIQTSGDSFSIQFDYAPPGAPYGKFMNDSFIHYRSHKKVGPFSPKKSTIGFADKAMNSSEVNAAITEFVNQLGKDISVMVTDEIKQLNQK